MNFYALFKHRYFTRVAQPFVRVMDSVLEQIHKADKRKLIMRFNLTVILLTTFLLQVSAAGYAQRINLTKNNISLTEVFKEIRIQSGYDFVYATPQIKLARKVDILARNASVLEVLERCFINQPFTFEIQNKTIVIKERAGAVQNRRIRGQVLDRKDGKAIPGATVAIKGTRALVQTDNYGKFVLDVPTGGTILVVRFLGYKTQEILLSDFESFVIKLDEDQQLLDQVVVSTGYQTIAKDRATGSFSQIKQEDMERKLTLNLVDKMEGMASGLLLTSNLPDASGRPTKNSLLSIRGRSTISATQNPLIIVDGFPYESELSLLNPEDISTITFLKDAAAASIWGVRASNGVVVIETKHGKAGKSQINFSTNFTIGGKPDLAYRPVASSADYLDFEKEAVDKSLIPDPKGKSLPAISSGADIFYRFKRGEITAAQRDALVQQLSGYDYKTQYSDYLLQKQQIQQYNLSASGGNELARYFVSGSYSKELPVAKGDQTERFTLNSKNDFQLSKRLQASTGLMLTMNNSKNNGLGLTPLQPGISTILPYDRIVGDDGKPVQYARAFNGPALDALEKQGYLPWRYDYLSALSNADNTVRYSQFRVNGSLQYKIIDGVNAQVSGLYERSFQRGRNYYNPDSYSARNTINNATSILAGSNPAKLVYGLPVGGILDLANADMEQYNARGQLVMNRKLGSNHRLDAVAGLEMRQLWTAGSTNRLYGYDDQTLSSLPVNYATQYAMAVTGSKTTPALPNTLTDTRDRFLSWYTNANYTFKEKYVISGSARLDDSNLFGASKEYRATPLWSVGGMWKLGQEDFLRLPFVDRLNLRVTYGVNGNVDKTTSPFLTATVSGFPDFYNGLNYAVISNPANPLLRWEKTKTFNIGADVSLWKDRLEFSLDIYKKRSYDLLGPAEFNPTYGFTSLKVNTGRLDNHGVDLNLTADVLGNGDFQWKSQLNFGYNENKVVSSNLQRDNVSYYLNSGPAGNNPIVGKSIDGIYSTNWGGLDSKGRPTVLTGDGKQMFVENDISNDLSTLTYSGTTVPKYFGGFTNTFHYKQFDMSFLITYKLGYVFRRPSIDYSSYFTQKTIHSDVGQRWRQPGDETKTNVPVMPSSGVNYNSNWYTSSNQLIESGDHVRLREISLSYSFAPSLVKQLHVRQLSVMAYARNLGLIWAKNKEGIDPDFVPSAYYTILPTPASFALGLRASF
ncbi:SusC/RagA family TonB-linked outer membrane protein [Pedobacter sp. HMWF019]|uniref:SusC/RagA family TonB-linked outer membrane protein n=1 Tax=Pedobacter sp. HMWF019 TaxID=2056856 RepID=UPI001304F2BB|nr:SusC/RagA family TonB-linked outer membrane protein [Pedobacter sp. HMWF019]